MKPFHLWFVAPVLALLALLSAASIVRAQSTDERLKDQSVKGDSAKDDTASQPRVPLATDWSHHYLVYSNAEKVANSDSPKAKKLQAEPRFQQALARRRAMARGAMQPVSADLGARALLPADSVTTAGEGKLTKDWTSSLTTNGTLGDEQYPAKFSFNINAAPSCTSDFVVYTNQQPSGNRSTGFLEDAEDFGFFYGIPANGAIITIAGVNFTATSTAGDVGGVGTPDFYYGSSATQAATDLVAAIIAYATANPAFTFTASNTFGFGFGGGRHNASSFIIVSDTTGGPGGNATTASPYDCFPFFGGCTQATPHPNFSFFSKNFFGGRGGAVAAVANLIGFNELYTGSPAGLCSGTGPNVMFGYGVSTEGGVTSTSPALSADGTQVAVVESVASCTGVSGTCSVGSYLQLVKWKATAVPGAPIVASGSTNVAVPTFYPNNTYRTCPAPCMTTLKFSSTTDSNSAPFVDYYDDAIYVGDDAGDMAKLAGVFVGTPSVAYSNMPIDSGYALTGPIYDSGSGNVYVADANGVLSTVESSNLAVSQQEELDGSSTGYPVPDPPIVDGNAETVTVFESNDNAGDADLYQYIICTAASQVIYPSCTIGGNFASGFGFPIGPAGVQMHDGDFDNTYYNGTYADGYLYFCGKDPSGTQGDSPAIERATFDTNGFLSTLDTAYLDVTTNVTPGIECSPMTEVYNGSTDYMFFSVQGGGIGTNCTTLGGVAGGNPSAGCVMSVIVNDDSNPTASSPTAMPTAVSASIGEPGGTSGIIIDNVSASAQASSVYFSPLGVATGANLAQATAATWATNVVTFTFPAANIPTGAADGQYLVTTGFTPAGYNGTFVITGFSTTTGKITAALTTNPGTVSVEGYGTWTVDSNGVCPNPIGCAVKATQSGLN